MAAVLALPRHRSAEFYRASFLPFLRDRSVRVIDVRLATDDGVIADRRRWTVYDGKAREALIVLHDLRSEQRPFNASTREVLHALDTLRKLLIDLEQARSN
jgi:hypothetical protein